MGALADRRASCVNLVRDVLAESEVSKVELGDRVIPDRAAAAGNVVTVEVGHGDDWDKNPGFAASALAVKVKHGCHAEGAELGGDVGCVAHYGCNDTKALGLCKCKK